MVTSFSQCVRLSVGRGPDVRERDMKAALRGKKRKGGEKKVYLSLEKCTSANGDACNGIKDKTLPGVGFLLNVV